MAPVVMLGGCPADVCNTPITQPATPAMLLDVVRLTVGCGAILLGIALMLVVPHAIRRGAMRAPWRRGYWLVTLAGGMLALAVAALARVEYQHYVGLGLAPRSVSFDVDHAALRDLFLMGTILRITSDGIVAVTTLLALIGAGQLWVAWRRGRARGLTTANAHD